MSTISDIVSGLSAAAPYATAIEDLATLGIDITKLLTPDQAQSYEDQLNARIQEAADDVSNLLANPTSLAARQRINDGDDRVFIDAGRPLVAGMDCPEFTIRVDRYLAYRSIADAFIYLVAVSRQAAIAKQQALPSTTPTTTPTK